MKCKERKICCNYNLKKKNQCKLSETTVQCSKNAGTYKSLCKIINEFILRLHCANARVICIKEKRQKKRVLSSFVQIYKSQFFISENTNTGWIYCFQAAIAKYIVKRLGGVWLNKCVVPLIKCAKCVIWFEFQSQTHKIGVWKQKCKFQCLS